MNRRSVCEIAAVGATGILHPVFAHVLHQRAIFIVLALCGWGIYLTRRVSTDRAVLGQWGLRKAEFAPAFIATSTFAGVALAAMAGLALANGTLGFRWQMVLLLALYPLWGTFQQLMVQGLFVRSVSESAVGSWAKVATALAAALLFGAVHLPHWKLVAATCAIGFVFTAIYLRWKNIWPLGLYHGWLGVFYYYWVLERDPWTEIFAPRG